MSELLRVDTGALRIGPARPGDHPRFAELTTAVYRDEELAPAECLG